MAKVLFVNPTKREERIEDANPFSFDRGGLRLAMTAGFLRENGITVDILDSAVLNQSITQAARLAARAEADIVVISTNPFSIGTAAAFASKIKYEQPGVVTVLEGPFVESVPENTLETYRSVDYGLIGDPEESLLGLCACVDNWEQALAVPGLAQRDYGHVILTEQNIHLREMDELPLPAWDLLPELALNYRPVPPMGNGPTSMCVVTARGTPGGKLIGGRPSYRSHSSTRIFEMLRHLSDRYHVTDFAFIDAGFLTDEKRVVEFCQMLVRESLGITWSCVGSADHYISDFGLKRMAEAGCRQIMQRVDSGSDAILTRLGKAGGTQEAQHSLGRIRAAGIEAHGLFTIGVPGETAATLAETEKFILESPLDHLVINFYRPTAGMISKIGNYGVPIEAAEPSGDIVHFLPRGLSKETLLRTRARILKEFYRARRVPKVQPWKFQENDRPNLVEAARKLLGQDS